MMETLSQVNRKRFRSSIGNSFRFSCESVSALAAKAFPLQHRKRYGGGRGFTYIELLITLTIMAVLFVPIMQLFSHSLRASSTSQDLITATSLARWEMEKTKNLSITKQQLSAMGDLLYPPMDEEPMELNEMLWRIKREIIGTPAADLDEEESTKKTDPLEVRVHVYPVREKKEVGKEGKVSEELTYYAQEKPLVSLVTLFEDMYWEEVKPIK